MAGQDKTPSTGCVLFVAVLGLVVIVGMCSPKETAGSFSSPTLNRQIEAVASATPLPVAPLDEGRVRTSRRHLLAVVQAEGLSGAMIYSQNCYDALSRSFDWGKLDQCGGFDLLAVGQADGAPDGLDAEIEYFAPEAAAGRYLTVATKAGEAPAEADLRLEALQREASRLAPVPRIETKSSDTPPATGSEEPLGWGEQAAA